MIFRTLVASVSKTSRFFLGLFGSASAARLRLLARVDFCEKDDFRDFIEGVIDNEVETDGSRVDVDVGWSLYTGVAGVSAGVGSDEISVLSILLILMNLVLSPFCSSVDITVSFLPVPLIV